jgi:hypothetical protein
VTLEKKAQDLAREALMEVERRFCPFVLQRRRGVADFMAKFQASAKKTHDKIHVFPRISCYSEAFGKDFKSSIAPCTNKQICIHVMSSALSPCHGARCFLILLSISSRTLR